MKNIKMVMVAVIAAVVAFPALALAGPYIYVQGGTSTSTKPGAGQIASNNGTSFCYVPTSTDGYFLVQSSTAPCGVDWVPVHALKSSGTIAPGDFASFVNSTTVYDDGSNSSTFYLATNPNGYITDRNDILYDGSGNGTIELNDGGGGMVFSPAGGGEWQIESNGLTGFGYISIGNGSGNAIIDNSEITTNRTYELPDEGGSFALGAGNGTAGDIVSWTDANTIGDSGFSTSSFAPSTTVSFTGVTANSPLSGAGTSASHLIFTNPGYLASSTGLAYFAPSTTVSSQWTTSGNAIYYLNGVAVGTSTTSTAQANITAPTSTALLNVGNVTVPAALYIATSGAIVIGTTTSPLTGNANLVIGPSLGITGSGQLAGFGDQAIGSSSYAGFGESRMWVGYDGASQDAILQSTASKGIQFSAGNSTFGSGIVGGFDSSGNFGVGTAAPGTADPFYVSSAGAVVTTKTLSVGTSTSAATLQVGGPTSTPALIVGNPSSTNALVVAATGNVGIGTSTPSALLDIYSAATANTLDTGGQLTIKSANSATPILTANSTAGANVFVGQNNGTTTSAITQAGGAAFGTSTAPSMLTVNGNVQFNGSSTVVTPSIGGAITTSGCDSATTTVDSTTASTSSAFITQPESYPGPVDFYSVLTSPGLITTYVCADITITPSSTAYVVKIIK